MVIPVVGLVESCVSPLNSTTVPVTRTMSPRRTSVPRLPPWKTNTPSEVFGRPSGVTDWTKKPWMLRVASASPFW